MTFKKIKYISFLASMVFTQSFYAQEKIIIDENTDGLNWYNEDITLDKIMGISVDKAYNELLKGKTPKQKVIVAVIDGGVDVNHEDLVGKIWINSNEIPNNQIDDDSNGYVDDINGWNFIGNANGENVLFDNLEITRLVRTGDTTVSGYQDAHDLFYKELKKKKKTKSNLESFEKAYRRAQKVILEKTGVQVHNKKDLAKVSSTHPAVTQSKDFLSKRYSQGFKEEMLTTAIHGNEISLNYYLNVDFDCRTIVGDDLYDFSDRNYGNNDVIGPKASHGTSVAGVIAANRNNGIGINGIAENVEIMVLRTTPDGDERDKDVALAIIYAVDQGAKVINMSFGKSHSPQKNFVDIAIKYAEDHGVLLIHSSGNSGENLDKVDSYPCAQYLDSTVAKNWMNVGASNAKLDKELPGVFSNYGQTTTDLFSPGVNVISLDTNNTYSMSSGTSIAGPMVAAVAATVWSYYPELTVQEMITLLRESTYKVKKPKKVLTPSLVLEKREKASFSVLSISGGIVNLYNALEILEQK